MSPCENGHKHITYMHSSNSAHSIEATLLRLTAFDITLHLFYNYLS